MQGFLTALSVFVTKHQSLRVLRMGGQQVGKLYLSKYIGPFLPVFASTRKLEELDISGNQMGDDCLAQLADALRVNKALKSLYWDDNRTTAAGWAALVRGLKDNFTLVHAQYPANDILAFAPRGRRGDRQRAQAEGLMSDLSKILNRNQSGGHGNVRIRGQTFAQSYMVDQNDYRRSLEVGGGGGGGGAPPMYKQMQAPPPLAQAYPTGAPLDRQQQQQQQPNSPMMQHQYQQQNQQQQQTMRNMAPPPSMAEFQAQRGGLPPTGGGGPGPTTMRGPVSPNIGRVQQPPQQQQYYAQQQQQGSYRQPQQQQQQYGQGGTYRQPQQQQQHQQQQHYQQQQQYYQQQQHHQQQQHYAGHQEYYEDSMDLPPPPPAMGEYDGYDQTYEDQGGHYDQGYDETYGDLSDLPPPPPPGAGEW